MKLFTLITTSVLISSVLFAQQPRRFIKPAAMCPINYSTISTKGLNNEDQITLRFVTYESKVISGQKIPINAISKGDNNIIVTDTSFGYSIISNKGLVFEIIQEIGSFTIIKFWNYTSESKTNSISEYQFIAEQETITTSTIPKKMAGIQKISTDNIQSLKKNSKVSVQNKIDPSLDYYLVKTEDIKTKSEEFEYVKGSWNVGIMYLPIKLRPFATKSGAFDFTSNINLGVSFSVALKQNLKNDLTTNFVAYIGVSSIKIDSSVANNKNFKENEQESVAFSPAVGLYWQKKSIQLGVVVGMDFLVGDLQKTWVYRGMPWFSLTAGVNLFNLTNNTSAKEGKNKD